MSNISWKNILKQIELIKYVVSIKKQHSQLFIVDGKINRHIINSTMDNRIKKIIIDPLVMFSYLKTESDYYKWTISFKESIRKRTKNLREKLFLGLSGGYDSGAICCELLNQNIPFSTYTVIGTENENILNK